MNVKIKNRLLSALFAVAAVVLIITFSIGLPIYVRGFYYAQIDSLNLPERTGHTKEEIREAYDEVLDFLTIPGREFGSGVFRWSESGKSHFEDCKVLFDLNIVALIVSLAVIVTLGVLIRRRVFELSRPFGHSILLTCGASTLGFFALLGIIVSIDFDTAFVVFHSLFFPGKDNWIFDARTDEIIRAMPQKFFMNCAILIASSIIIISVGCIVYGIVERRLRLRRESKQD